MLSTIRTSTELLDICTGTSSSCLLQPPPDCESRQCLTKFTIIIFPLVSLFFGVLFYPLSRHYHLPYTLVLLILGAALGAIACASDLGLLSLSLQQWVHLNPPTAFLYVFLAPLIFEAAFNTRWHVFKRLLPPIIFAAFVLVIIQNFLIAYFQLGLFGDPDWTIWSSLMFGAMLSATDPISVTATLKSVGASEMLGTLIEGESLLNDGSAFVLFEAFLENSIHPGELSVGQIIVRIFRLSIGGALLGVAFALPALVLLGLVYDEFEVETSLTVIIAFLGFWTAQAPSLLSGVICNVASGLVLSAFGRHLITPAVRAPLAEFWELLAWIANTIVFVHAGVLLTAFTWSCAGEPHEARDYLLVPGYYLYLQVIRFVLILLSRPLMALGNRWYGWKEASVVGFSGLRGAISLILALEVAGTEEIPEGVRSRVVLWTTGVVGLSLLINGVLIKPFVKGLKLDKANKSREEFLHRARAVMVQRSLMILDALCVESGFRAARWSYVVENVLPEEWLKDPQHEAMYEGAVGMINDNVNAHTRRSLDLVRKEDMNQIMYSDALNVHRSLDRFSLKRSSIEVSTPRFASHGRYNKPSSPGTGTRVRSPGISANLSQSVRAAGISASSMGHLSLGPSSPVRKHYDYHGLARRSSIDADMAKYNSWQQGTRLSQTEIHRQVQELHEREIAGQKNELDERDREVQRRLLTAILSHVRAMANVSFVEFSVLHNLEEDVQRALDANDEERDYNLFAFLDNHGRQENRIFQRTYLRLLEGKRLKGETSITTAVFVFGVLTQILKEGIPSSSPAVQLKAEQLYLGAASLLNRLEALNPTAFQWVQSQFAIYLTITKQDEVLKDMLNSGIVDDTEHNAIHHELIAVRRKHVRSRHSLFTRRASGLPTRPTPRALIKNHPLFRDLNPALLGLVERFGSVKSLKAGERIQAEKGSLILVLSGAIRPLEDDFCSDPRPKELETPDADPEASSPNGSTSPSSANSSTDINNFANGSCMHWCFRSYSFQCGPSIILGAHNTTNSSMAVVIERTSEKTFGCCEMIGSATVFTLPVAQVQEIAGKSPSFRLEITKSLARELVLESVNYLRPYSLSHFMESVSTGVDESTVVGRAFRALERLPYMTVVEIKSGDGLQYSVQGPGVLLNGKVRVSIVDTSGLVGAVNLLHEEITGPALLPGGGLIIEGIGEEPVAANVLVEAEEENLAGKRLQRWVGNRTAVDMNGRFGMYRHVEMAGMKELKIA